MSPFSTLFGVAICGFLCYRFAARGPHRGPPAYGLSAAFFVAAIGMIATASGLDATADIAVLAMIYVIFNLDYLWPVIRRRSR